MLAYSFSSGLYTHTDGNIFLGFWTDSSKWAFMKFNPSSASPITPNFYYEGSGNNQQDRIFEVHYFSTSNHVYIAGLHSYSSVSYACFIASYTTSGTEVDSIAYKTSALPYYSIRHIATSWSSSTSRAFVGSCAEASDGSDLEIFIV